MEESVDSPAAPARGETPASLLPQSEQKMAAEEDLPVLLPPPAVPAGPSSSVKPRPALTNPLRASEISATLATAWKDAERSADEKRSLFPLPPLPPPLRVFPKSFSNLPTALRSHYYVIPFPVLRFLPCTPLGIRARIGDP